MLTTVTCPSCGRQASLPEGFGAGRVGCPHCHHPFDAGALLGVDLGIALEDTLPTAPPPKKRRVSPRASRTAEERADDGRRVMRALLMVVAVYAFLSGISHTIFVPARVESQLSRSRAQAKYLIVPPDEAEVHRLERRLDDAPRTAQTAWICFVVAVAGLAASARPIVGLRP